jgi:hypothetical protein
MAGYLCNNFWPRASAHFLALDVIVSAVVMQRFIRAESSRLRIAHVWLAIPATLLVGVSLGLPLFLYLRELQLEQTGTEVSSAASGASRKRSFGVFRG